VPTQMRTIFRAEIEAAISAIAIALDELERDVLTSIRTGPDNPPSPAAVRARAALNAMDARLIELRPTYISRIGAAEAANAGAFTESLHEMVRLIERPLDTPPPALAATTPVTQAMAPVRTIDPALIRYSAKVGLCIVIGYIVGLTTQQPGLSTILTTVIITALPTYGATMRKMILRIMGGIVGGIITIIAIVISTPNFRTLPSYLIVTFVVLAVSAYSSLSSGRVAYAGKQIATTFLLVFAGLSPSADIYGPLWRIWGIFLGTVVVMIVFILVKPEYAGNSLLPRLRKVRMRPSLRWRLSMG
jgi:multidrug resistance protein MdtO